MAPVPATDLGSFLPKALGGMALALVGICGHGENGMHGSAVAVSGQTLLLAILKHAWGLTAQLGFPLPGLITPNIWGKGRSVLLRTRGSLASPLVPGKDSLGRERGGSSAQLAGGVKSPPCSPEEPAPFQPE